MKKLLAFLLVAALILSMGTTVFAIKGGDGDLNGAIAFEFSSEAYINGLKYGNADRTLKADSENANSYDVTALYEFSDTQTQAQFHLTEQAVEAFSNSSLTYVNILIRNAQDEAQNLYFYVTYNGNTKTSVAPGWSIVSIEKKYMLASNAGETGSYSTGNAFTITGGAAGQKFNIDKIWLTEEHPDNYSYAVSSDSAILWQFNSAEAVDDVSIANADCPTLNVDYNNVNAYNVSATFTTNGVRKMQFKFENNTVQETDENGNYKYDYLNFLVGNLSSEDIIGFGCGINSFATAITSINPGWSVVSVPIDTLFRPSTSSATGKRNEYSNVYSSGMALQMCDDKGGNGTNKISGIVYNFDMIWVSKTPAAVGDADNLGIIVSQVPLTCTDAVINSDGTASCKITNWPGERFVVIFATYNADGSLNSVDCVKDYDGGENKETVVNSSKALTIPEGGTTKVMVWNGFGEIAPMTTVK